MGARADIRGGEIPGRAEELARSARVEGGPVGAPDRIGLPPRELKLVGREGECRRVSGLLAAARGERGGALVLSGEPGVGKSALCAWAVSQVVGMRLLSARGVESEVDIPFAGLSELCAAELDRIGSLPEPQARALEGALARREAPLADRFAIGAALLGLLSLAAERQPVLVLVDDAQWLDASSADALLFAARRLREDAVALLVATRPGGVFDAERTGLSRIVLRGLDRPAALALLEAAHGVFPSHVAQLLADRTGGNPLALLELPLVLSEAQRDGEQPIDEPLPLGPTLVSALLARLSGLSDDVRRGLLVAAASGGERVQPVVDALAELGIDRDVLDVAEQAGALSIAGERFEFRHPLLRSAVYHGAPGPARRAAHAALGRVAGGVAGAWHLAQATIGEDEAVAATLEQAAIEARQRGAPAAAASALRHAARLSPAGEARVRRLTQAASDAHLAGQPAGALGLLDDALAGSPDATARAAIQHLRGRILTLQGQTPDAYRLLVDEAHQVRELDPDRSAAMLAEACLQCLLGADVQRAIALAREAHGVAAHASPGAQAFASVILAFGLMCAGERREASTLLDRFLPLLRATDPLTEAGQLIILAAQCYFYLERDDVASELLGQLITAARKASAPAALLMPLCCRAELDLRTGRWAVAAAQFEEAASLGEEMAESVWAAYPFECLAYLAAATGDEPRCREQAARAMRLIDEHRNEIGRLYVQSALGLLELGLGRVEEAIRQLRPARDLADRHGLAEPNMIRWQGDLIEASSRSGDADGAQQALTQLERQAQRTGGHWALGTAARCRGLLADDSEVDACFAAALEHLEAATAPFDVARTHLCHGERLRRARRRKDARRELRLAIDRFNELGATPWTTRAEAELRATGETPRRSRTDADRDQLTAHELQVALIVAGGASNREAASALFLSPKTIEFHLAHIYRKLGLRSRTELAAVAARRGWLQDAAPLAAAHEN